MEVEGSYGVQNSNQHTYNQKAGHNAKASEIDIEFQHLSDAYACPRRKFQSGVTANPVATTSADGLVGPQNPRHKRERCLIQGCAIGEMVLPHIDYSHSTADQIILIQSSIDELQVARVLKIDHLKVCKRRE